MATHIHAAAKRMFIVDTMAMAFRSFHAFSARPLSNSSGLPTSAIYGSALFLLKLIEDERPDYLIMATDTAEPTFRHAMYKEYKAHRKDMPEDLAKQIPHLERLYAAMGCHLLRQPGVEADDLIGSLVKQRAGNDLAAYIVSGDKDFLQLVNSHIFLYSPKKNEAAVVMDEAAVQASWGCRPDQIIDILALMGDASDNIPGVSGIGEKTAASLIQKFGSLDGIYARLDDITNKRQRENLERERDAAYLSQKLVTIKTDCAVMQDLDEFACDAQTVKRRPELLAFFREMEFRSLVAKMEGDLAKAPLAVIKPPAESQTSFTVNRPAHYTVVQTEREMIEWIAALDAAPAFAFDTETTGLDIVTDKPIGMSFAIAADTVRTQGSTEGTRAWYVPLVEEHLRGLTPQDLLRTVTPLLGHPTKTKVGHNLKFDMQMMRNVGIVIGGAIADTMLMSYVLDSVAREHGLDALSLKHLGVEKIPTSALIGAKGEKSMREVPLELLGTYAAEDAACTWLLYETLKPQLAAMGVEDVFTRIEMPLVPVLASMERYGVHVDAARLAEFSADLAARATALEKSIHDAAGEVFNINSTKQLGHILFEKLRIHEALGVTRLKKTQSGFSTDQSVLERLAEHPLPKMILDYRSVTKLKNTYVDTLPQLIHPQSARIHTSFHQAGTATGRLSSSDPNLQNIPIRTDLGAEIRRAFVAADPTFVMLSADYSQVELRLLAHLAEETNLADAFRRGADIHTDTAARIFQVSPDQVTREQRSQAKAINFGIIYGMGPQRLARQTGTSMETAKAFIARYFATYPRIEEWIDRMIENGRNLGYAVTITGRRRPIPELKATDRMVVSNGENIAVNSPVQGSAADLIKIAMIAIDRSLKRVCPEAKMLMQVHDELVFECPSGDAPEVAAFVKNEMERAMQLSLPLVAEVGFGRNWLEAH